MPINAHFIQAAKLLTPGASYQAGLVLPHVRDLAGICQRIDFDGAGEVVVRCGGRDSRGEHVEFPALAKVRGPTRADFGPPPKTSAVDGAAVIALLVDEALAEFGVEPVVAAAWEIAGAHEVSVDPGLLLATLAGRDHPVSIRLRTPGSRLRLRADGSMAIGLQITR